MKIPVMAALLLASFFVSEPSAAQVQQFGDHQAVSLQPDKAYFLIRSPEVAGGAMRGNLDVLPVLIRILSREELEQAKALSEKDPAHWKEKAEPNVVTLQAEKPYERDNGTETLLVAAKPGTYILGGMSLTNWATAANGIMTASLCMGTVKFEAKAGIITDLGTILTARDDQPTSIPELAKIVSGKPSNFFGALYDVALRQAAPSAPVPAPLRDLARAPADYRAAPAYPNYAGAPVSRLAPLQGVLDYNENGDVIDLKAASPKAP